MKIRFQKPSILGIFDNLTKITGNNPQVRFMITDNMRKAMIKRKKQLTKKGQPVTVEAMLALIREEGQRFLTMCEERFNISNNEWENMARIVIEDEEEKQA